MMGKGVCLPIVRMTTHKAISELSPRISSSITGNRYLLWLLYLGFAFGFTACTNTQTNEALSSPRLILQITVDQLLGDLPTRHHRHHLRLLSTEESLLLCFPEPARLFPS